MSIITILRNILSVQKSMSRNLKMESTFLRLTIYIIQLKNVEGENLCLKK